MKVSVLIPTYNYGQYIEQAIRSVLAQTFRDYEIIVVDDGSEDNTEETVKQFPEVVYYKTEHSGVGHVRNRALELSSGEYVAFLDSDDYWACDKLEKQVEYLNKHSQSKIIFTEIESFLDSAISEPNPVQIAELNASLVSVLPSALIRKQVFQNVGYFKEGISRGEDTDWLLRAKNAGLRIDESIPEKLYFRRIHASNSVVSRVVSREDYLKFIASSLRRSRAGTEEK